MLSLIFALPIALAPIVCLSYFGFTVDLLRFEFRKPELLREVADMASSGRSVVTSWGWREFGMAGASSISYTLVYDDSDQIRSPPFSWSIDFRQRITRAEKTASHDGRYQNGGLSAVERGDPDTTINALGDHFYLVNQLFQ